MTIERAYYISELEEVMENLSPDIMNNGSPNQDMRIHSALTYLLPELKGKSKAALSQAEPVCYQSRMRPGWINPDEWTEWEECSKGSYEDIKRVPINSGWHFESRALYEHPPKPAPLPQPALQCVPKKEWNQVTGRDGRMYTDGWNDCADYANKTSVIDEINVAVTQPVASVPQDEWTFDELDLRGPGDFMTAPPEGWESSDWRTCLELKAEMHNKKVYRAEIKRLRALIANKDSAKSGPQDVEEFIAEKQRHNSSLNHNAIHADDLRAWMAGHARVPDWYIAAAEKAILTACNNAVEKLNELAPQMGWDSGEVVAEMHIRPLRKLLAASQQEGV